MISRYNEKSNESDRILFLRFKKGCSNEKHRRAKRLQTGI